MCLWSAPAGSDAEQRLCSLLRAAVLRLFPPLTGPTPSKGRRKILLSAVRPGSATSQGSLRAGHLAACMGCHGRESSPAIVMSSEASGRERSSFSSCMYSSALRALWAGPGIFSCMSCTKS